MISFVRTDSRICAAAYLMFNSGPHRLSRESIRRLFRRLHFATSLELASHGYSLATGNGCVHPRTSRRPWIEANHASHSHGF